MSKLEKAVYYTKYTVGSYVDAIASIPIWLVEKTSKRSERILGERNPNFLSWNHIKSGSEIYNGREKLREKLDTKPGALFIQSNVIGAIPFFLVGMPAAELAQEGIDTYLSRASEIVQYATNSAVTLTAQMVTGYTGFMVNEVRTNKQKYVNENMKLSAKKIGSGLAKTVKAFLSFDIPYIVGKLGGQSYLLSKGKDPWIASGIFDSLAIPAFSIVAIPLGLWSGVIETKQTKKRKKKNKVENYNP